MFSIVVSSINNDMDVVACYNRWTWHDIMLEISEEFCSHWLKLMSCLSAVFAAHVIMRYAREEKQKQCIEKQKKRWTWNKRPVFIYSSNDADTVWRNYDESRNINWTVRWHRKVGTRENLRNLLSNPHIHPSGRSVQSFEAYMWHVLICDHPRSGVVYNIGRVCLSDNNFRKLWSHRPTKSTKFIFSIRYTCISV